MNTDEYMTDPDRLELLHEWLSCDDEAGKKLWFGSNFFGECKEIALRSAHKHKNKLKDARLNLDDAYLKKLVTGWLWEKVIHPWKAGKTPADFATLEKCRNLVSVAAANRVVDLFKKEQGLAKKEKKDPVVSGDAEDEKEPGQQRFQWEALGKVSSEPLVEPDEDPAQHEQPQPPFVILHAFYDVLVAGPTNHATTLDAAVDFFSDGRASTTPALNECGVAERLVVAERIIEEYFDEKAHYRHTEGLYDHLRASGKKPPGTYTSRLRETWQQFRDGEGSDLWTAYTKQRFDVKTEFSPYVSDPSERPLWGRIDFGLEDFDRLVEKLQKHVHALRKEGGGVLAVPHDQWQEPSVGLLLSLLVYRLYTSEDTGKVRLLQPDLEPHRLEEALGADLLIVSHLPRLPGLLSHLESSSLRGKVVVGTGIEEEWQCTQLPFNHRTLGHLPEANALTEWMTRLVEEKVQRYTELPRPSQRLYETVAVWDARAVPLRFDLLARALGMNEGTARTVVDELVRDGLLYRVNPWTPENLRVATKSPVVAQVVVEALSKQEQDGQDVRLDCFHTVFKDLDPERKAERYLMLQLFQSALPESRAWQEAAPAHAPQQGLSWANALIRSDKWGLVKPLFEAMDSVEAVLWGRALARLRLFDKADAVLETALENNERNAHLLHARAQTLADQVQINASLANRAQKAFEEAAAEASNCYIYQSWAVMRAKAGGDPTRLFEQALRTARTPGERAATRVAWADYETERGKYETADDYLDEAESDARGNAYISHVRGKAAFLGGDYADAEEHFQSVLDGNLHNVPALNALGYMARLRGHWDVAEQCLKEAHRRNPENVPTLHERGNLLTDMADAEARTEDGDAQTAEQAAERERQNARAWHEQALALEPDNVQVLVSLANALLPQAADDAGKVRKKFKWALRKALKLSPRNVRALHVFSRYHRARAQRDEAHDYLRRILDNDKQNLPALCTLAHLQVDAGDEEAARDTLDALEHWLKLSSRPLHEHIRARNAWAEVEHHLGETARAIKLAEEARKLDEENEYTRRLLRRLRHAARRNL